MKDSDNFFMESAAVCKKYGVKSLSLRSSITRRAIKDGLEEELKEIVEKYKHLFTIVKEVTLRDFKDVRFICHSVHSRFDIYVEKELY